VAVQVKSAELLAMSVAIRTDREGEHARLVPTGSFDLAHAMAVAREVENAETLLSGCDWVDVDLAQLDGIDGAGAVLLARFLDRLDEDGRRARVIEGPNNEAARLIALYRERRVSLPAHQTRVMGPLTRIGAVAADLPGKANEALDFTGRCAAALPKTAATPSSVDWPSLPRLIQDIGADALPVTSAANILVGVIVGFLGVSQLGRFGADAYVPQLVVVAHLRELGPMITAMVVAGRSGAGLASEIATMKVTEEIDALRSLGFDPVRWLVVPRCLALVVTLPILTWIGDLLALLGGLAATTVITNMTPRAYIEATLSSITAADVLVGLTKTPFLALAIGLIACGQGLATRGGAAAVGSRTTTAVVQATFSVIVISAVFTFFFALIGV
jgi:phospholipid/cholesterol/gamma-HCH transport system permease protein